MFSHANTSSKQNQLASAPARYSAFDWEGLDMSESISLQTFCGSLTWLVCAHAETTYLYKSIQLLWLCKLTSVVCCYLVFKFADGQEFSVSQRDRGCWGARRWAPPSKPEQTTTALQNGASEVGQFVEFVGTVETPILSPHFQYVPGSCPFRWQVVIAGNAVQTFF